MVVVDCRQRVPRPGFREHSSMYCTCRVSADRRGTRGGKVSTANACSALAVRLPAGNMSHLCMVWQNLVKCRMDQLTLYLQAERLQVRGAGTVEPMFGDSVITMAGSLCIAPMPQIALAPPLPPAGRSLGRPSQSQSGWQGTCSWLQHT